MQTPVADFVHALPFACGHGFAPTPQVRLRRFVAIYHLSVKTIGRSAGRSAVAAAAYRAGALLEDLRTGDVHDYRRKRGIESSSLVLPEGAPAWDRSAIWNQAEAAERRRNATVAREFEIALPAELDAAGRLHLAHDFAREIVVRHGCAADVSIHAPGKDGDLRNHHAHILVTTRRLTAEGFTAKTRELDDQKSGEVDRWRARFAELQNERLQQVGTEARVDHRSLKAQGIEREPTQHLGPIATGHERRTGQPSRKRQWQEVEVAERLAAAKAAGELERQGREVDGLILDLSGDIAAAMRQREQARDQARQEARQAQARDAEEAELKRRLEALSAAEFRRALDRLRPLPVRDLVDRDPQVLAGEQAQAALAQRLSALEARQRQAAKVAQAWRQAHPLRARLHDAGLVPAGVLTRQGALAQEAQRTLQAVRAELAAADRQARTVREAAEARIAGETAPARQRAAALESVLRQKEAQERREAVAELGRRFEELAGQRARKAAGCVDGSPAWDRATPGPLRTLVDRYNALGAIGRKQLLEDFLGREHGPEVLSELMAQRQRALQARVQGPEKAPKRDRGFSR